MLKISGKTLEKNKILLSAIYLFPIFTAFNISVVNNLVSVIVLICVFLLIGSEEFYYALPSLMFFYIQLRFLDDSVVVFRIYTLLLLLLIIRDRVAIIHKKNIYSLIVCIAFTVLVLVSNLGIQSAVMNLFDIVILMFCAQKLGSDEESFFQFGKYYILAAGASAIYNFISGASVQVDQSYDGELRTVTRFLATFNDVNYTGFYFVIALFLLITLRPFKKWENGVLGILIAATIVSTVSTTALIATCVLFVIYIFVSKQNRLLGRLTWLIVGALIIVALFSYGLSNPDAPIIGDFVYRISGKFGFLSSGYTSSAVSDFTTGRSSGTLDHLEAFVNQSPIRWLFGMNPICAIYRDTSYLEISALNEYVDLLLSAGIVGWCLIMIPFFADVIRLFKDYRRTENNIMLAKLFLKFTWIFYGLALTFFMDSRFYFFYFI